MKCRRKKMKIKRVGTISMAVVLIAFGIVLFLSQINKFSALNMVLKMWPVILILIGLEVLWYRYAFKDEGAVIKYDFFSIFTIFIILIVNIGIFAVNESGIIHRLESMFLSSTYDMDMPIDEYIVDESINKIIIDDTSNMVIRATSDKKISGISKLNVYASNKEEADKLAGLNNIKYEKSGSIVCLYCKQHKE
jgi:signal transduction histidine kinase